MLEFEVENINPNPPNCIDFDPKILGGIKCVSINPNSLNISDHNTVNSNRFYLKLNAVLKLNRDILCIQDPRLANKFNELEKEVRMTRFGRYKAYANSNLGQGGVLTLIRDRVPHKIYNIHRSLCQNVMIIDLEVKGFRFLLANTYGPRHMVAGEDFFKELKDYILSLNVEKYVVCGDLNAITCASQPTPDNLGNIELFNTVNVPNIRHSRTLVEWISDGFCIDKFRVSHPNLRIFSYIPHNDGADRPNRSRIDNLLCSNNMNRYIKKVEYTNISHNKCDHKPLLFTLGQKPNPNPPKIDQSLLQIPFLQEVAKFSLIEVFVDHSNVENKVFLQNELARASNLSKYLQALAILIKDGEEGGRAENEIDELRTELDNKTLELQNIYDSFPSYEEIENLELTVPYDDFLQVFLNALNNSVIAHQTHYVKGLKKKKAELTIELDQLRKNNNILTDRFKEIERDLLDIENQENLRLVKQTKFFNLLNNEKITGPFAELLKNSNDDVSMSSICRQNENNENISFDSINNRNEYIRGYYQNLFGTAYTGGGDINDFLGEHRNDPSIQNFKISNEEREALESFFTEEELLEALKTSNKKSASGLDGIGFATLDKFWPLVKNTMLKAFNKMIENKQLKGMMLFSKVRLLRKGSKDPTKLANWRPISLLTATYKLFSGIVNLRLQKIVDKICHRSQKAYSSQRSIHESVLNVFEILGKAKRARAPIASVLVDFSRAFDAVGHQYIRKALEFHNIGPFFCDIIMTTLKNRKACIIDEEGGLTPFFDICIGVLQGDRSSPQLFKLCINPLLIRLSLERDISLPPQVSSKPGDKADPVVGFADDLNILCLPSSSCFTRIKAIFEDFGNLSNLRVNNQKTKIIFHNAPPSPEIMQTIENLSYSIGDTIDILGFSFKADLSDLDQIWEKILRKIKKIRNFWQLLHLSVAGKINVVRTYFLSQLSYFGTILTPPTAFIKELEDIILKFVNPKLKIAKDRIFRTVNTGGLGIPHPENFCLGLKMKFFLNGIKSQDNWGNEAKHMFDNFNNIASINPLKIDTNFNPFLAPMANAFCKFVKGFLLRNGNVKEMLIFDSYLYRAMGLEKLSFHDLTLPTRVTQREGLLNLRIKDCLGLRIYNHDHVQFMNTHNLVISYEEYKIIVNKTRAIINKCKNNLAYKATDINTFCNRKNLKSKDMRIFIENNKNFDSCTPARSRALWSGIALDHKREEMYYSMWNKGFMPIGLRDFICKLVNNKLNLRGQVSHFAPAEQQESGNCTFCRLNNTVNRESYKHFFIECQTNIAFLESYFQEFLQGKGIDWNIGFTLSGAPNEIGQQLQIVINTEIFTVLYFINHCRNRKVLPNIEDAKRHTSSAREVYKLLNSYRKCWAKFIAHNP